MAIIIVLLFVFALLMIGGGGLLWLAVKQKEQATRVSPQTKPQAPESAPDVRLPVRWRYVVVPLLVLLVSIVAAACFFRLLPSEMAYGYGSGTDSANYESRGLVLVVLLAPQFILTFLSAAVAHVVARVGTRFVRDGSTPVAAIDSLATVMSNMVVLPQLILCYAMIDLFRYNAYGTRLPPLYLFAVVVMLVGGGVLGVFFLRAIQQARAVK